MRDIKDSIEVIMEHMDRCAPVKLAIEKGILVREAQEIIRQNIYEGAMEAYKKGGDEAVEEYLDEIFYQAMLNSDSELPAPPKKEKLQTPLSLKFRYMRRD